MENFWKKLGLTAAAAGTMASAEAQAPAGAHATETSKEQQVSPKTAWTKELLAELDSAADPHGVRDGESAHSFESKFVAAFEAHIAESAGYSPADWRALSDAFLQANRVFKEWEEGYGLEAHHGRMRLLAELDSRKHPGGQKSERTMPYPGVDDGGSQ